MKATGIVRRIDELGRVVIPKEIRRTLRIREGDALEIYTDREGGVILKKYSLVGELCDFAKEYAESIQQSVGHIAAICDKDTIIAISSPHRRDIAIGSPLAVDKPIHDDVEAVMQMREKLNRSTANGDAMIGTMNKGVYTPPNSLFRFLPRAMPSAPSCFFQKSPAR